MNPLKFKVIPLYKKQSAIVDGWKRPCFIQPIAYQLTPCGCYVQHQKRWTDELVISCVENPTMLVWQTDRTFHLKICGFKTSMPFLIPAEHYEQFKQAVHEYNLKCCEVPDVKVLDGYKKWLDKRLPTTKEVIPSEFNEMKALVEEYKATLVSSDMWFEMESE